MDGGDNDYGQRVNEHREWMKFIHRHNKLTPGDKNVLVALAFYENIGSGELYPSVNRLAADTCLSPRQVNVSLKKGQDLGLLNVTRGGGRGNSNCYERTYPDKQAVDDVNAEWVFNYSASKEKDCDKSLKHRSGIKSPKSCSGIKRHATTIPEAARRQSLKTDDRIPEVACQQSLNGASGERSYNGSERKSSNGSGSLRSPPLDVSGNNLDGQEAGKAPSAQEEATGGKSPSSPPSPLSAPPPGKAPEEETAEDALRRTGLSYEVLAELAKDGVPRDSILLIMRQHGLTGHALQAVAGGLVTWLADHPEIAAQPVMTRGGIDATKH